VDIKKTRKMTLMGRKKVIIMGAAGRDFHNFNVYLRDNPQYEVVAFTAAQIPNITGRKYPPELAGKLYPDGIPIFPEEQLPELIKKYNVDEVVFSYSDVSHEYVMHKASLVLACGADFRLLGPRSTMLKSKKPVISVCAVRTGAGKSPTSRKVCRILRKHGKKVVVVRHPMPYGDLAKQACQRFETYEDLDKYNCTIEEREDYEPHLDNGFVVYAGVDYEKILRKAEEEADIILWDGGNNDLPFFEPSLHLVVADALRAGHELSYHPGETNFRMANVIIINKVDMADKQDVEKIIENAKSLNPRAKIVKGKLEISVDKPELIEGKRVIVIEDGPTLTHGGMSFGAGFVIAERLGCDIIDPRPYAVGSIKKVYEEYSQLDRVLPAVGYGKEQISELEKTVNKSECDAVVIATPSDLGRFMKIDKPYVRVRYELEEIGKPDLEEVLREFLR
jgi:predicted GTPase